MIKLKPGLYEGMSYAEYADIDALSRGDIAPGRSWLHSRWNRVSPHEQSDALDFGKAVDALLLEPDRVDKEILFVDEFSRATSEGKRRWAEIEAKAAGRTIIRGTKALAVAGMMQSYQPFLDAMLGATPQVTVVWEHRGRLCKGRIDIWNPSRHLEADLKTTKDASPRAMQRSIIQYGYHYQRAWYRWGLRANGQDVRESQILAVEKEPPFGCACYTLEVNSVDRAEAVLRRRFDEYLEHERSGFWPGYEPRSVEMSLPGWAFDDNLSDMEEAA